MSTVKVTDSSFETDVLGSGVPRRGRFLGGVVRPL